MNNKAIRVFIFLFSTLPVMFLLTSFFLFPLLAREVSDLRGAIHWNAIIRLSAFFLFLIGMLYSLYYIAKSTDFRLKNKKGLWMIVILLGNVFALPVFWYLYMPRDNDRRKHGKHGTDHD